MALLPGIGARLTTATAFVYNFSGTIHNHDGNGLVNGNFTVPPVFTGPAGIYLLGDAAPMINTGTNIFINLLGRLPNAGEQVTLLDALPQTHTTSTYLGNGSWDVVPTLGIAQAGYFNLNTVPEPSTVALISLGLGLLAFGARRVR